MKKRSIRIIACILALVVVVALCVWNPHYRAKEVSYALFYEEVNDLLVESATLTEDKVYFYKSGDSVEYVTENPQYTQFKEFLLLHEVSLTDETSAGEMLYMVIDLLINLVFIGVFTLLFVFIYRFFRKQFSVVKHVDCHFSDIAGMDEVKDDLMQLVELIKRPDDFAKKGTRQPNGILLVGPPGNGKTLFARALAGECDVNFIATKATDFQSMYMSIGPAKIKALFRQARKCAPCIVFIDEFDGLGERRNYAGQAIDKENNRMVTALLNELDGFERHTKGVLVIAATNNLHDLDPALIRPGRFDRKYVIKNPDQETRCKLIDLYLRGHVLEGKTDAGELAESFAGMSCAQIEAIMNEACLSADTRESDKISERDIEAAVRRIQGRKV